MNTFVIPSKMENKEKALIRFKLPMIQNLEMVSIILALGYRITGHKFTICFNGSKGYLSNIEIACEGPQKEENRIFIESLRKKNRRLKSIIVNVYYSEEHGVRISTGKDEPKAIEKEEKIELLQEDSFSNERPDLPF